MSDKPTEPPDMHLMEGFTKDIKMVDGRYEVKLPWKEKVELSNNRSMAGRRFRLLSKRLVMSPGLMGEYDAEMRWLLAEGIAEPAADDSVSDDHPIYYMPYQPVLRQRSSTNLRIVFDALSHGIDARSLNKNLESGPNLNPDLIKLLPNFRCHCIVLVADVKKAFLQLSVAPEHRDALWFLWYTSSPEQGNPVPKVQTFRMARVPFGITSSLFLLAATLQRHVEKIKQDHPETADLVKNSIYIDDLICGAETAEQAVKIYEEMKDISRAASMGLHKCGSNSNEMMELFSNDEIPEKPLGQPANLLKVLGLTWQANEDVLTFAPDAVIDFAKARINTKRFVLQTTARLYDPLGFLSPYMIRVKAMFQEIWKQNIEWDQSLPDDVLQNWTKWCEELPVLQTIKINTAYDSEMDGTPERRMLYVFADASTKAYGAVVYLCSESTTGQRTSSFVISKCRVAPVKTVTLARLELMATFLTSRLFQFMTSNLKTEFHEVHIWTDSMIALSWIQGDA